MDRPEASRGPLRSSLDVRHAIAGPSVLSKVNSVRFFGLPLLPCLRTATPLSKRHLPCSEPVIGRTPALALRPQGLLPLRRQIPSACSACERVPVPRRNIFPLLGRIRLSARMPRRPELHISSALRSRYRVVAFRRDFLKLLQKLDALGVGDVWRALFGWHPLRLSSRAVHVVVHAMAAIKELEPLRILLHHAGVSVLLFSLRRGRVDALKTAAFRWGQPHAKSLLTTEEIADRLAKLDLLSVFDPSDDRHLALSRFRQRQDHRLPCRFVRLDGAAKILSQGLHGLVNDLAYGVCGRALDRAT
eukprot:scaffold1509_cov240-Pinguiococcus_pyrenoidosus.AAC.40